MIAEADRQQFFDYLRRRGMRVTSERLALLEEIWRQDGYIDVPQILAGLEAVGRKVSRATVYRNLELLVECGLVRRRSLAWRRYLYQRAANGHAGGYLTCRRCGRLEEFSSPSIQAMLNEVCRAQGFSGRGRELRILGLCEPCAGHRRLSQVGEERAASAGSPGLARL